MVKKVFKIFGISHVVIAVFCMLIGVVVEFLQVHIYKNNISFWQLQATKTVDQKSKKSIQPDKGAITIYTTDDVKNDLLSITGQVNLHLFENTIYSRYLFDLITSEYIYDKVLRGPPVS